ncbi:lysis protein, partial [Cronobacter sakazakii]|uniref:lysis system i-spanin subunit Rz n=2 Tax=Enterobacteriaceae TaxID=543 RepID=UPI000D46AF77
STSSTSMDDGAAPRLTGDAEQNYFSLRDGIATVTKQLTGLQAYVREQCLK